MAKGASTSRSDEEFRCSLVIPNGSTRDFTLAPREIALKEWK